MKRPSFFTKIFLIFFIPQITVCLVYWIFFLDWAGGTSHYEYILSILYAPIAWILLLSTLAMGWAGVGLTLIATPLVGSVVYSLIAARIAVFLKYLYVD